MGLIYKITNKLTNKVYIGKTSRTLKERWFDHISRHLDDNTYFHRAIKKYGIESFYPEIIEDNIPDQLLNEREQYWIAYYNSYENGYNCTRGGDGGTKFFEEQVLKTYFQNNENKKDTLKELQCSSQLLNQILSKNNLSKTQRIKYSHREIANKYLELKNIAEVAKFYSIDRCTVIQALKDCEINTGHKKAVAQIDKDTGEIINIFSSQSEAAKLLFNDVNKAKNISSACLGKIKSAYGYVWQFYPS